MGFFENLFSSRSSDSSDLPKFSIRTDIEKTERGDVIFISGFGCINPFDNCRSIMYTSILDITKGTQSAARIYSRVESFTEEYSPTFQHKNKPTDTPYSCGYYEDYARISVIPLEILVPPYGGKRKLLVFIRVIREHSQYQIHGGFSEKGQSGLLAVATKSLDYFFKAEGYKEARENLFDTTLSTLDLATILAMSDGSLHSQEGMVIKKWMHKSLSYFPDNESEKVKKILNLQFKNTYGNLKKDINQYQSVVSTLKSKGSEQDKIEALRLCYEVLAADGQANENELTVVKKVASDLNINHKEVNKIRDLTLISLDSSIQDEKNIDAILSIEPDWDKQQIEKHLYMLYGKWSGRLNALNEQHRREAQSWVDTIADAKKKHGV